ncbi:MAG: DUF4840 domain-containing protein [Prevotella sp.]|nr:DUF4840 domain-containing protein [Prevotella sp.]
MTTKHFFSILLGCLTALCVTSCLGSDDDANNSSKGLSKAEIAQCYLTVGGNYSGDLLYFSKSDDGLFEEVDTLNGAWYIPTDSTLFITDFPSEVLAENVIYSELKDALAEAPDQIVKCRIRFVETSPVQFLVNPYTLEYMLHYGGGDHKVQVVFYNENIYSFGILNAESRELMLKIIPAYLYVDGKQTNYLTQSQIIFVSRKQ